LNAQQIALACTFKLIPGGEDWLYAV